MKLRRAVLSAIAVILLALPLLSNAQLATFDASNLLQNIEQLAQLAKEMENLQQQLQQAQQAVSTAKSTYNSLHGSSGMGTLLNGSVGQFGTSSYGDTQTSSSIQSLANTIKQQAGYLSSADLSRLNPAYQAYVAKSGDAAAAQQAQQQQLFDQSGAEFKNIQALMDQINTAQDPKVIQGLQARIQVEQAVLQNQLIRAQAMTAMMQAQDRVNLQQQSQDAATQRFDYFKGN